MIYDPKKITYDQLLKTFWENHDPTQGMRQGNDIGTQYRSGIYTFTPSQKKAAEASKAMYEQELKKKRYGAITTEIVDARSSILPRTITSSTWPRIRLAIAGWAGPGSPARSEPAQNCRKARRLDCPDG